jgi:site-specific recombinase XerD
VKNQVLDLSLREEMSVLDPSLCLLPSIIEEYLLTCKLDGKPKTTRDTYEQRLRGFTHFITAHNGSLKIGYINSYYVKKFIEYLSEKQNPNIRNKVAKIKPVVVNAYYRVLKRFFNYCLTEKHIKETPMIGINPPKFTKTKRKYFSLEDLKHMLFLCQGERFLNIRNNALILVFLDTGLRLDEMANIMMDDFNLNTGLIFINHGKGDKERIVKIEMKARKALLRYLRFRNPQHQS